MPGLSLRRSIVEDALRKVGSPAAFSLIDVVLLRSAGMSRRYSSEKLMLTVARMEIWPGAMVLSPVTGAPPKLCMTFCAADP